MPLFDLGLPKILDPQGNPSELAKRKASQFQAMQDQQGMGLLDAAALATAPVPIVGDFMGLGADLWRYATDPQSRTPTNYGLSALGLLPFIPGITAWHGSPHKFDKFDSSRIGTGEGAQAYGHGLYFAEKPGVAKNYAAILDEKTLLDNLSTDAMAEHYGVTKGHAEKLINNWKNTSFYADEGGNATDEFFYKLKNLNDKEISEVANANWEQLGYKSPSDMAEATKKFINADSLTDMVGEAVRPSLYKVDIPDENIEQMIDWDAPLSKQKKLKELIPNDLKAQRAFRKDPASRISDRGDTGEFLYHYLTRKLGSADAASAYLASKGVKGIKYFDQVSRGAGKGTHNFVVFDDKIVKMLERK